MMMEGWNSCWHLKGPYYAFGKVDKYPLLNQNVGRENQPPYCLF